MILQAVIPFLMLLALMVGVWLLAFNAGKNRGILQERIRLTGNSLPRYENPPAPQGIDPKGLAAELQCLNYSLQPDWAPVEERLPKESGRYWCYIREVGDLGTSYFQWNCYYNAKSKAFSDNIITKGENVTHWRLLADPPKEKVKGVPVMKDHPPMPEPSFLEQEIARVQAIIDMESIWMKKAGTPIASLLAGTEVTPERLIEALFDYRLDTFIAHHSRRVKEDEALYYNSRKEVAEYLLDMYYITPKAKH